MVRRSGQAPRVELRTRSDRTPAGIHTAAGAVAVLAALMLSALLPVGTRDGRLVPVAVTLLLFGLYTVDALAALAVTALAYLLVIGFLVDRYGVLSWHGVADLYRLAALATPAAIGLLIGAWRRSRRRPNPVIVPPEWAVVTPADPRALTLTHLKVMNEEEFPGG